MRTTLGTLALAMALGGCATRPRPAETRPYPALADPAGGERIVGWRLTERAYGSIGEVWSGAGDGAIPPDQVALVYEPMYREEKTLASGLATGRTACGHEVRVTYDGPVSQALGQRVELTFWVEGPLDVAHVVEIAGSHPGISVLGVSAASPLAGRPGRYVIEAGARSTVAFTSRTQGRGGIRISVESEMASWGGRFRPARSSSS
jgi:hypothetical protein